MSRLLICPSKHEWDPTADPETRAAGKLRWRCPVCGDVPALGSAVGWELNLLACAAVCGVLILLPIVVMAIMAAARMDRGQIQAAGLGVLISAFVVLLVYALLSSRREAREREAVARGLRLAEADTQGNGVLAPLAPFPLGQKMRGPRVKNGLIGVFQRTEVILADLECGLPWVKGRMTFTVVFFPEPVPGLPDFEVEPVADRSKFWNKDLFQVVGLRRQDPLQGQPFGQRYRMTAAEPDAVLWRLTPEARDQLARHPGWAIQARQGRLLIFQPYKLCPARALPVLLSLAWRVRELLRASGSPVASPPAGAAD
jgi:hypothetical protein